MVHSRKKNKNTPCAKSSFTKDMLHRIMPETKETQTECQMELGKKEQDEKKGWIGEYSLMF